MVQMKQIKTGKTTVNLNDLKIRRKNRIKWQQFDDILQSFYPDSVLAKCQRSASGSISIKFIEFGLLWFNI